ncbi:MAG: hypothetical protein C4519_04915 [Desulfobacteraceae bacterium]|nr:MAG: hypothetical protein C4519_04915 [Desulfobacteraceae bacterium]
MPPQAWVYLFVGGLAIERGIELLIARRNERWMRSHGAREYGRRFSRMLFLFHGLWFLAFLLEASIRGGRPLVDPRWIILVFLLLQLLRYWCIAALGYCWNTKIIVLPGTDLVRRGPYRWLKHPNYLIVRVEIAFYPAIFGCFLTALLFGIANLLILKERISQEKQALPSG